MSLDLAVQKLALAGYIGLHLIHHWKDSDVFNLKPILLEAKEFFMKTKAPDGSRIGCSEPTARAALREHEATLHLAVVYRIWIDADEDMRRVLSSPFSFLKSADVIRQFFLQMYASKKSSIESGLRIAAREQWPDTLGDPNQFIQPPESLTVTKEWKEALSLVYLDK